MISANIIAYNEEANIERCLKSLSGVAGEIILVHDGECRDRTLQIARKYTKKVYVRPHVGESVGHRVFAAEKSRGEWLLILDADEYLSPKLQREVQKLVRRKDVDGYTFYWPFYDKGREIRHGPLSKGRRLALMRKSKTIVPVKFHVWYKVQGKVVDLPYALEHNIPFDNWQWSGFFRKNTHRTQADARWRIMKGYAKYPAPFYAGKAVLWFVLVLAFLLFVRKLIVHGELGVRIALFNALYNLMLYWYVFKYKLTGLPW